MPIYRENAEHAWTADSVRLIPTPSPFAKASLFHIQEVGHFRALPAYYTERERLDSFLIVYTLAGRGKLTYQGKKHLLNPGDAFFIDCMEYQHYASDAGSRWELIWAHANGPAMRAHYELFAAGGPVRELSPNSRVASLLNELLEHHRTRSLRSELLASLKINELLAELLLSKSTLDKQLAPLPENVAAVIRYIDKHAGEKLSLDRLGSEFAVGKHQLAKTFKKHTGFSPGEYIINVRISRAKELLKYSDCPVAEIAERIGIDNVSHFIRLFRDREGQTPLVFRKSWQEPKRP